jgi:HEPN domain-containing protein
VDAFHAQQVIEKCFKAVAEENGISVMKTHDLIRLYKLIHEYIGHLDEEILYTINELYIDSRYPGDLGLMPGGKPSTDEAEKFVLFADSIRKRIYQNYY